MKSRSRLHQVLYTCLLLGVFDFLGLHATSSAPSRPTKNQYKYIQQQGLIETQEIVMNSKTNSKRSGCMLAV